MSAILSPCELFRYRLEREVFPLRLAPVAAIFGVNPSTADATVNDQTIRKDIGFAERLGYRRIIKGNKFAFRAKDVRALREARDPIGPDNDKHIEQIMRDADVHIVAWGPLNKLPPNLRNRWRAVVRIAEQVGCPLFCWGTAKDGHPRHPLMLAYNTPLIPWIKP